MTHNSLFVQHLQISGRKYEVPVTFVTVITDKRAWRAGFEEALQILIEQERWADTTPAWVPPFVPSFSAEDEILLRAMQSVLS
jgi:hypothetical protein